MTGGRAAAMIVAEVPMDLSEDEGIYTAGDVVPPGRYCRVDRPEGRTLILEQPGFLPGSLDGHVAVYQRLPPILDRRPTRPSVPRHAPAIAQLD